MKSVRLYTRIDIKKHECLKRKYGISVVLPKSCQLGITSPFCIFVEACHTLRNPELVGKVSHQSRARSKDGQNDLLQYVKALHDHGSWCL